MSSFSESLIKGNVVSLGFGNDCALLSIAESAFREIDWEPAALDAIDEIDRVRDQCDE